ncbi:MAG: hypothetical protein ABI947_04895 [Chloroflexota bacterium]
MDQTRRADAGVGSSKTCCGVKAALVLENALLRQQLTVLDRQVKRPTFSWKDRWLMGL